MAILQKFKEQLFIWLVTLGIITLAVTITAFVIYILLILTD